MNYQQTEFPRLYITDVFRLSKTQKMDISERRWYFTDFVRKICHTFATDFTYGADSAEKTKESRQRKIKKPAAL